MSVAQMPAGLGNTVRALLSISALAVVLQTGGAGAVPPSTPKAAPKTLQPEIIERVDQGRADPGRVGQGRVDPGPAFVERVDKGPAHVIEALKCLQAAPSKEATRECNVAWMAAQQDQVVSIQASPDDRLLAALHFGGRISLYDVTTQKKIAENKIEGLAIRHQHLSFSPDGRFLGIGMPQAKERADGRVVVAAGQGVTSIVDLKTGKTCEHRGRDGPTTFWETGRS